MDTIIVHKNGDLIESTLTREQVLERYAKVNVRDLRPVFLPFQVTTILPRADVVIVNLGFIKAIIAHDNVLFVIHRNAEAMHELAKRILTEHTDEFPFPLAALDTMLQKKVRQMNKKVTDAGDDALRILHKIKHRFSESELENLLLIKKRITKLETRLKEIGESAEDVLEDDDDLALLANLSKTKTLHRAEGESIIENFSEQIQDLAGHIFRTQEDIEDTEEFITLKLDARRTAIIRMDLLATMVTLVFSSLAVVVGLYGVNIANGFENDRDAFSTLTAALVIFFIIALSLIIFYLRKKRLF